MTLVVLLSLLAGQAMLPDKGKPAASRDNDVVVTARKPSTDAERKRAVSHMVATVTPVGDAERPLPRFQTRVCARVDGLPPELNRIFAERVAADARSVGLQAVTAGCRPNVSVLILPDSAATVGQMQPALDAPGEHGPTEVRAVGDANAPVHQWEATELRSRDGDRVNPLTRVLYTRNASIIQAATRTDITGTVIVFDQAATIGKTVNQLADYAAMRALAQIHTPPAQDQQTILRLFADDEPDPPRGWTMFDRTYLKTLYRGAGTERPFTMVGQMVKAITKQANAQAGGATTTRVGDPPAR